MMIFVVSLSACRANEVPFTLTPSPSIDAGLQASEVSSLTPTIQPSLTATPTIEPTLAPTGTLVAASATPNPTEMAQPSRADESLALDIAPRYKFSIQPGSAVFTQAWLHDCNWTGVAGQVFGTLGFPLGEIVVEAGGELGGTPVFELTITGLDAGFGPGGFEITLGNGPVESHGDVWLQLKDNFGNPLSPLTLLETRDSCEENLILLNFVEDPLMGKKTILYFPLIFR